MRTVLGSIAMSAAVVATDASAQGVNLTGPYRSLRVAPVLVSPSLLRTAGSSIWSTRSGSHLEGGWTIPAGFGSRGPISVRSIRRMA